MKGMDINAAIEVLNKKQHLGNANWRRDPDVPQGVVCFGSVEGTDIGYPRRISFEEAIKVATEYEESKK